MTKRLENKTLRRGGRPSQEEAGQIRDQILDIAQNLFFTHGYGVTSIEAIASAAHISKRTFYHRFKDKADVFRAVVHRIVESVRPHDTSALFEGKSCAEILHNVAQIILHAALKPEALALHRIMLAEAMRFPELALMASAQSTRSEAIRRIGDLLQKEVSAGRMKISNPAFAAEQFLQLVVSSPQRRALGLGKAMTKRELDLWADESVTLFLHGCNLM